MRLMRPMRCFVVPITNMLFLNVQVLLLPVWNFACIGSRHAPIIGHNRYRAVLPINGVGQLVHWYRPIVVYAVGKYKFFLLGVSMVEIFVFERGGSL